MRVCPKHPEVLLGSALDPEKKTKNMKLYESHAIFQQLGDGFKYFLCSPLLGEDSHFD